MFMVQGTLYSNYQRQNRLAERGFDPRTSGLWAQHASTAPLCSLLSASEKMLIVYDRVFGKRLRQKNNHYYRF